MSQGFSRQLLFSERLNLWHMETLSPINHMAARIDVDQRRPESAGGCKYVKFEIFQLIYRAFPVGTAPAGEW